MIRWMRFEVPDNETRNRICGWLSANAFDPNRVPLDAYAAYDTDTDEFVVEHFAEPKRVDPDTKDIRRVRIRRRRQAWMSFA